MPAADLRSGSTRGEGPAFRPGSPLHDQDLKELGLALVGVVDLTADLARREHRRVDVHVRNAGAHRSDELAELARRDALARRSDDISGGDGSGDHALLWARDRKSTRLNSSHLVISYAVFCLKKKKSTL